MAWATARHILVDTEEKCNEIKAEIEAGLDFGDAAKANSNCPSKAQGGDLGKFGPGQMVPEFDAAIFSGDVGVLYGPIETDFGFHLIDITGRG